MELEEQLHVVTEWNTELNARIEDLNDVIEVQKLTLDSIDQREKLNELDTAAIRAEALTDRNSELNNRVADLNDVIEVQKLVLDSIERLNDIESVTMHTGEAKVQSGQTAAEPIRKKSMELVSCSTFLRGMQAARNDSRRTIDSIKQRHPQRFVNAKQKSRCKLQEESKAIERCSPIRRDLMTSPLRDYSEASNLPRCARRAKPTETTEIVAEDVFPGSTSNHAQRALEAILDQLSEKHVAESIPNSDLQTLHADKQSLSEHWIENIVHSPFEPASPVSAAA